MALHRNVLVATSLLLVASGRADSRCRGELCHVEDDSALLSLRSSVRRAEVSEHSFLGVQCPGSQAACDRNQCCPGTSVTGGKTFPCPNSDDDFNGCEGDRSVMRRALDHAAPATSAASRSQQVMQASAVGQVPSAPAAAAPQEEMHSHNDMSLLLCPGGGGNKCVGNVCCEGNTLSGGMSFPCPNADADFAGCQGGQDVLVKALVGALNRTQKYTFLHGVGWANGSWALDPEYYIGDAGLQTDYGIPTLNMQDGGQGFRTTSDTIIPEVTGWPVTLAVASSWSEDFTRKWATALGKEFKAKGANVILGPGLNVHRVARGGRNAEYVSGESPYFGARMAAPYVEAVQSEAVLAVAKHYALNSQETNRDDVDSQADDRTLWEVYYPPFEAAVKAGAASVMCAYNLVNGVHACGNPDLLNRDLKQDMGFGGWVMSDWWALHNFGANEGVDQEMPGSSTPLAQAWFTEENMDTLSDAKVDDMVSRMLTQMLKYGLFEPRNHVCSPPNCHGDMYNIVSTSSEHQALNKELAGNALVLLKNEGDVLPVPSSAELKLAFVGRACFEKGNVSDEMAHWDVGSYYNMGGSGRVIANNPVTILEGVQEMCNIHKCSIMKVDDMEPTAVTAALETGSPDYTFLCAGTSSTEGHDRENLSVDDEDFMVDVAAAIKANSKIHTKVVSLTMTPGAILTPWIGSVDAAMNIFLAGKYTGTAFAENIFGIRNPSAKLLVTFPASESQTVQPCENLTCPYTEKLDVGYLALQDEAVAFPFGHGLSYTTFAYSGVKEVPCQAGGKVCIEVMIKNTGRVPGAEIAQLYLSYPAAAGEPRRQLRGFKRLELAPAESTPVHFELLERDLSVYNAAGRQWEVPQGTFSYFVGSSSRDESQTGSFEV